MTTTPPGFRAWLEAQRTTNDPSKTGVTGADLVARIVAARGLDGWSTPDDLHGLIHPGGEPWVCEALADAVAAWREAAATPEAA